jgi:Yip1-like protein
MGNLAIAIALATSPSKAFEELRARPRFWFPLLAVMLSSALLVVWYYSVVDIDWLKDALFANNPDIQKMPEAQRAQAMNFVGRNTMLIMGVLSILVALPFFFVLNTLYYMLAGKITKVQLGFKHWFTLTSWSALPALLGAVVAAIFLVIRENDQIPPSLLQPLGLNELVFHLPLGSKAQSYLDALNIPGFLGWILAIIGVRTWSQRSWLFSSAFVLIPWVLFFGIWGFFAFS